MINSVNSFSAASFQGNSVNSAMKTDACDVKASRPLIKNQDKDAFEPKTVIVKQKPTWFNWFSLLWMAVCANMLKN